MPGGSEEWNVKGVVPENDDEEWQNVVIVNRNTDTGKVNLNANWRSNDNPGYSVPPSGVLTKQKERYPRSFVLSSDFIQPPSIFPVSISRDSMRRYWTLVMHLQSFARRKSSFAVSIFALASLSLATLSAVF